MKAMKAQNVKKPLKAQKPQTAKKPLKAMKAMKAMKATKPMKAKKARRCGKKLCVKCRSALASMRRTLSLFYILLDGSQAPF